MVKPNLSSFGAITSQYSTLKGKTNETIVKTIKVTYTAARKYKKRYDIISDFKHYYTIDADNLKEFEKQKENTFKAARSRLKSWMSDEEGKLTKKGKELLKKMTQQLSVVGVEEEIDQWKTRKKIEPLVDQIQEIEEKRPRRTEEFSKDIGDISKNVEEYDKNLDKAEGNIKFEDNIRGSFEKGRSRTTGDLDWYDEKGEKHEFIIYDNSVTHVFYRDGERETVEMSKSAAKDYYREDRLG